MLTGRRQSANHCTIEACALAGCSKRLTWLRSRGFHGMVAFLASAAAVTPRRRSLLLDHATGGTLACAGPVVWPTQTVGKARPAAMTAVKAAVVAMRGAIAATTERRTGRGCSCTWRTTMAIEAARYSPALMSASVR